MIVVTGAAGFIGSNLVATLNENRFKDLVLVDDFSRKDKEPNWSGKIFSEKIHRDDFFSWLDKNHRFVQFVFHLGARTDTTEFDPKVFARMNVEYSMAVWNKCVNYGLPLVYASSAATYGDGSHGYDDNHAIIPLLKPLNPYGESKNEFDKWALTQPRAPYFWAGIKFFNVYGPNEYHKGRMASVVFHAFRQIKQTGKMLLFRSHRPSCKDGEQQRDFIYVKDVCDALLFFMHHRKDSGIYNLGTGKARTFLSLARSVFKAMGVQEHIEFIDTPADIRDKYQYFTEARMDKLRSIGYHQPFTPLEKGVEEYVREYLLTDKIR